MNRSDPLAIFLVSFIAGGLIAVGLAQVLPITEDLWPGLGAACAAAVAAFLFKRQQDRRY